MIPAPEGAPAALDGAASDEVAEMAADELCRVRLRYKAPTASEEDPAQQMEQRLAAGQVAANLESAAADLQWAAGIAAFAEILKRSPFARPQALDDPGADLRGQRRHRRGPAGVRGALHRGQGLDAPAVRIICSRRQ